MKILSTLFMTLFYMNTLTSSNPLEAPLQAALKKLDKAPVAYQLTIECHQPASGAQATMHLQVLYLDAQHFRIRGDALNLGLREDAPVGTMTLVANGSQLWLEQGDGAERRIIQSDLSQESGLGMLEHLFLPTGLLQSLEGLALETQIKGDAILAFGVADATMMERFSLAQDEDGEAAPLKVSLHVDEGFPLSIQTTFLPGITTRLSFSQFTELSRAEMAANLDDEPKAVAASRQ